MPKVSNSSFLNMLGPALGKGAHASINYLIKLAEMATEPLFGELAKRYGYGARKGFDVADIIDVPSRAVKGAVTPLLSMARKPLSPIIDLAGLLPTLSGDPYTPETIGKALEKAGVTKSPDIRFTEGSESGWREYNDMIKFGTSRYSKLFQKLLGSKKGVEPVTVFEELGHARGGKVRSATQSLAEKGRQKGGVPQHLSRLVEETRAKGVSAKNVFTKEGMAEGLLSLPSLLATLASYAIPSPEHLKDPESRQRMRRYQDLEWSKLNYSDPYGPMAQGEYYLSQDRATRQQDWENPISQGYMRAAMAQSANPLNQLAAYFGIQPLGR